MRWRNKELKTPGIELTPASDSRIEVEVAKDASKEAVAAVKKVNQHFNNLLVENGITVKIYLGAGGKHKGAKR